MKVLHVVLGNPNTHNGGLVKYCLELMEAQKKAGNSVSVLYPGAYITGKNPRIKKRKTNEYYIFDALPVAITYGVGDPERYVVEAENNPYDRWLEKNNFDIIHVHSLQGIHKEFFIAAKNLSIPLIYTSHDYYSFCPRSVLVDSSGNLCEEHTVNKCAICNLNAGLSANKQRIIQSSIYQIIKNNKYVNSLKRKEKLNSNYTETSSQVETKVTIEMIQKYELLQSYYSEIMNSISLLHCNSNVAAGNYLKNYPNVPQKVIPITHSGLRRSSHIRRNCTLNIGYMGGMSEHKGYKLLYSALNKMDERGKKDWNVHLYGGEFSNKIDDSRYHYGGFFSKEEEEDVWNNIDVLVVGSQCWETFGFIVLEALCRGIPVICSDLVGAKDLVNSIDESLIIDHGDPEALAKKIEELMNQSYYKQITCKIEGADLQTDMDLHAAEIQSIYKKVLSR